MPITYKDYEAALAPFRSFDPAAFVADARVSQGVCDFVLTLAVVFNDFKDVIVGHHALYTVAPPDPTARTCAAGMYNALRVNLLRLHAGIYRELFDLIQSNADILREDFFEALINKLGAKTRQHWSSLVELATARRSDSADLKALILVRNKVAFHYDPKAISQGFRSAFLEAEKGPPLVSLGTSLQGTRFYFADAAVQSYLVERGEENALMEILTGESPIDVAVNFCLYEIVKKFIEARGFAWRDASS